MALVAGGSFRTLTPTAHTLTNAAVIREFLETTIAVEHESGEAYRVTVDSNRRQEPL